MKSRHLGRLLSVGARPSKTVNYRVAVGEQPAGEEVDSGWVPEASPGRSSAALVAWMTRLMAGRLAHVPS
jgi:hypothetical protein